MQRRTLRFLAIVCIGLGLGLTARAAEIIIVGDSLTCGPFGQRLLADLSISNHVTIFCAVSSRPIHWLKGTSPGWPCETLVTGDKAFHACLKSGKFPTLDSILKGRKNVEVIVALGTNSLSSPTPEPSYQTMALDIINHGLSCRWIGPPHLRPDQALGKTQAQKDKNAAELTLEDNHLVSFYPGLSTLVATSCHLADSRSWTAKGSPGGETDDGTHREGTAKAVASGYYWADNIIQELGLL